MANGVQDSSNLPFLPPEWLAHAKGIVEKSLSYASFADVPEAQRDYVLDRVGEIMRENEVVAPENWRAALAAQCGWAGA